MNLIGKTASSIQVLSTLLASDIRAVFSVTPSLQQRFRNVYKLRDARSPEDGLYDSKFLVKYPKDGKYTTELLPMFHTHGRDPFTGRIVVGTSGSGRLPKYRWIDFNRNGSEDGDLVEVVIEVQFDPNRGPFIALVGSGTHLRYILATSTMKLGNKIISSSFLPETPIIGTPGNSYPVGAMSSGSKICHIEKYPGKGAVYMVNAGCSATVMNRLDSGAVVVKLPNGLPIALDPHCNCVCGQISNPDHSLIHIGSAARYRWLTNYPASGLWQRKDGYKGRKLRNPPPIRNIAEETLAPDPKILHLRCETEERRDHVPSVKRKT